MNYLWFHQAAREVFGIDPAQPTKGNTYEILGVPYKISDKQEAKLKEIQGAVVRITENDATLVAVTHESANDSIRKVLGGSPQQPVLRTSIICKSLDV